MREEAEAWIKISLDEVLNERLRANGDLHLEHNQDLDTLDRRSDQSDRSRAF